jgi:hypothetical protein
MACDAAMRLALLAFAVACSPTGGKPSVTPSALTVSDYEPARGAAALWASPDGKYLAAELIFTGYELPAVIKVIERASGKVIAHARGSVVAGPDNLGEVLYATGDDRAHPVLRSTTRADFTAQLPPPPGDFVQWSGYRLGATHDRVAVLRRDADGISIALIALPAGTVVATRTIPDTELNVMKAAVSPTDDILYLSGKTGGSAAQGAVVALDGASLSDRWRVPWPSGHGFGDRPALGVTGDGSAVAAYAPSGLLTIEARRGTGATVIDFYGHDSVVLVGVPGRPVLAALRTYQQSPERPSNVIEAIELPSGKRTKLRPDSGPPNPSALAVVGNAVLVAVSSPPRSPDDPSTWGAELEGYVKK